MNNVKKIRLLSVSIKYNKTYYHINISKIWFNKSFGYKTPQQWKSREMKAIIFKL